MRPLFHMFQSSSGLDYVFDVGTGGVFRIDSKERAVLEIVRGCDFGNQLNDDSGQAAWKECVEKIKALGDAETRIFNEWFGENAESGNVFGAWLQKYEYLEASKDEPKVHNYIIECTEDCNLRCQYCRTASRLNLNGGHGGGRIEEALIPDIVKFIKTKSNSQLPVSISFYGGEPLLMFKAVRSITESLIQNMADRKFIWRVTTNGSIPLTDEMVSFLVGNEFDLAFSLDGPKERHDRHRKSRKGVGTYDQIIENLTKIHNGHEVYYSEHVSFQSVIAPPFEDLDLLERFFQEHELVKSQPWLPISVDADFSFWEQHGGLREEKKRLNRFMEQSFLMMKEKLKEDFEGEKQVGITHTRNIFYKQYIQGVFKRLISRTSSGYLKRTVENRVVKNYPMSVCVPMASRMMIDAKGAIYLCERVPEAKDTGFTKMGDIWKGINESETNKIMKIATDLTNEICTECWMGPLCGLCFTMYGKLQNENLQPKVCQLVRLDMERDLVRYVDIVEDKETFERIILANPGWFRDADPAVI